MSIRITCPECETAFSVKDQAKGQSIRCKSCQARIHVPEPADDAEEFDGAGPRTRKKKKASSGEVRPWGVLGAAACTGVLMLLNLWLLMGDDEAVWKIIAGLRLFVEVRVLWGLKQRQDQTALAATVAAGMMTVISAYMTYAVFFDSEVQLDSTAQELFHSRIYACLQTLAEIGVLTGINLPSSKRFLSVR